MATVSAGLPERPHLDVPKREARELLDAMARTATAMRLERIRQRHPKFNDAADDSPIACRRSSLSDAQLVIAREYGFANWAALKQRIEAHSPPVALQDCDSQRMIAMPSSRFCARIPRCCTCRCGAAIGDRR